VSSQNRGVVPVFRGRISEDGRFGLLEAERPARQRYFRTLAGKTVDIRVTEHQNDRSARANAYYWGHVLDTMSKDGSDGDQSPEEIHDAMCTMFLLDERKQAEVFNHMTGEMLAVNTDGRRSSKLKGDAFYTFVEKVRKFALEFMGVVTEDPDPECWRRGSRKGRA